MQKLKIGKFSIFNFLDVKLKFLTNQVKLTQFSVESSYVKLKIWATQLKSSWKCEQLNLILIQVQNVNLKLNLMISLLTADSQFKMNKIFRCLNFNGLLLKHESQMFHQQYTYILQSISSLIISTCITVFLSYTDNVFD